MEKKHILLIENDENEVEFFADALEESNLDFLCSTARNTEQAIRILKNIMPDIIFLDIHISKTAGSALSKKIKQIQSLRKIPVVMYSNMPHEKDKEKIFGRESANYFHLPGNVRTMASILQYLLHLNTKN
jgi:DNA-binding response OmpR family regulator